MSAELAREFVDTNVLVCAFDPSAGRKKSAAEQLIAGLWATGVGCLSVQVLQEFFVAVTRKVRHPLSAAEASDRVREFSAWRVFAPGAGDVLTAIALHQQASIGFRDALVVHAAVESGCETLGSEDLSDGQIVRGVRIRNPFTRM